MSEVESARHSSRVGMVVEGKYEVLRLLGAGGMGEVYEARHQHIARRVALKFLLPAVAADQALLTRFRNEARAAGALHHENVAAVYDVGVAADGAPYFVMEFLQGGDCAEILDSVGTFSPARAASTVMQVCRGLAVAHAHGIIHRDLKPANLFLCRRADGAELVKILDFGIAKLVRAPDTQHSTGAIFGTPFYMSPERARGDRDVDHRSDIYALGVILYELLSGQRPYDGTSVLQILHCILTQEPQSLAELRRDLPASLCAVVHRAMARSPERRFASAVELEEALQPFATALPPLAASASPGARLDETMPEAQPEPGSDDDARRFPPSSVNLVAGETRALRGRDVRPRARVRRLLGWAVAAFATIGVSAWLLHDELDGPTTPAAALRPQAAANAAPAEPVSDRSIDRPSSSAPPATTSEAPRGEPAARSIQATNVPTRARKPQRARAAPPASSVSRLPLEVPPKSAPAKTESQRRLRIDRESPYQ